jgi:WD40 repeat protein
MQQDVYFKRNRKEVDMVDGKNESVPSVDENVGVVATSYDSQCPTKVKHSFPTTIIVDHILPHLDRMTYESVVLLNKEVYDSAKLSSVLPPPWPETILLQTNVKVSCVAFSSSSRAVACGCQDGSVYLWKRRNGRRQKMSTAACDEGRLFPPDSEVLSLAFSPNDRYLVAGTVDLKIRVWELDDDFVLANGRRSPFLLSFGNSRPVHSLSFFPNSDILASAGHDMFVRLWSLSTRQLLGTIKHPEKVESIAVAPNGKTIASSTWDGTVRTFTIGDHHDSSSTLDQLLNDTKPSMKVLGKGLPLTGVQWSEDSRFVHGLKGFRLRKWEMEDPTKCMCLSGRRVNRIHSIALSRQGHRVAYAEGDGTIRLSTLALAYYKADITRTLRGHSPECTIEFSPDGRCLASGSSDGVFRLWNVN